MEENSKKEKLLYDPIFDHKPPEGWEDSEKGGFFGKSSTKKAIFVLFLVVAIGFSLLLSFKSLSKKKYTYDTVESGCRLSEYNGGKTDNILTLDCMVNEDGTADSGTPVTAVRNYAVTCNEFLEFIFIGKDITDLEYNCFYYCSNLKAIFVDEANPVYTAIDGVLYKKDITEIIFCPIKNSEYRTALAMGVKAPTDEESCKEFLEATKDFFPPIEEDMTEEVKNTLAKSGALYTIPDTVTDIAPFCFSYCERLTKIDVPDGVKTIGQMSFFKCKSLESIYLPDGLESIGSDGLSYCETLEYIYVPASVKEIGHHAFFGCMGVEAIYMGAPDKDSVKTGEGWLPKQSTRSLKTVDVVYGAEREVK
ncbi:MAG: leucine-rich repeat domain-containing protein [Clostridia bacterium]|nr:leucine-rich repeat domain-containing protein [Clostridia bacterium]